jgi:murein L,D-transpeptidase YcbB/YkuD
MKPSRHLWHGARGHVRVFGLIGTLLAVLIPVPTSDGQGIVPAQRESTFGGAIATLIAANEPAPIARGSRARRLDLERLYALASHHPLWTRDGRSTREARDVLEVIAASDTRGLRPSDYQIEMLMALVSSLEGAPQPDSARLAETDVAISRALLQLLHDLDRGRVDPGVLGLELPGSHGDRDLAPVALAVSQAGDVPNVIGSVEPPYAGYAALIRLLGRYRTLVSDTSLRLPPTRQTVRPNDIYDDAPRLRRLLLALGDLPATAATPTEPNRYAGSLVLAVMHFQRRHGLEPDGKLGPATMEELRAPIADRVWQIELALERWRWLPDRPPARYIVINIPAFRLYAFENDSAAEHPRLAMNVIVGEAERRRDTPVFVGEMRELVFRPYWDIPVRIARTELVPQIKRGAIDMDAEGYEIVGSGDNPRIYPATRANLNAVAAGTLRMRQRPGSGNALGLVKFVFPNNHNVYLHGTPAVQLFSYARRDFSHGCIRAEQPTALAEFALCNDSTWNRWAIEEAMHGQQTLRIPLAKPVTVYILYITAVVAPDGTAYFYPDLYEQDVALDRALSAR